MLAYLTPHFGQLVGRYVLYLGENLDTDDGIAYRNAEAFLKSLPDFSMESGLENALFRGDSFTQEPEQIELD